MAVAYGSLARPQSILIELEVDTISNFHGSLALCMGRKERQVYHTLDVLRDQLSLKGAEQ